MQGFIDNLIRGWGYDPASWPWTQFVYVAFMGLFSFIVINFAAISGGIFSWAERRIAARMQSRVGPNRVGPAGFLQWIADAVKLLFKEDLIPAEADNVLFRAAPYFMMVGFACVFVALPFSHRLISALAEGNRTPFDLPEAESELVSGYNTEYSGMCFSYFFLVEWGNLWVMSALAVTMFMGGWQVPFLPAERLDVLTGWVAFFAEVASVLIFALKTLFFVFVVMWLRWTLPRIRVDQMMNMCWKYLVPASFVSVLFVAGWMLIVRSAPAVGIAMRFLLAGAAVVVVVLFVQRVAHNFGDSADKFDFTSSW